MKELNLTEQELQHISTFIQDVVSWGEDGATGGMYAGNSYITPTTCYNVARALKKIEEYLYKEPTIYRRAYNKLMKFSVNK